MMQQEPASSREELRPEACRVIVADHDSDDECIDGPIIHMASLSEEINSEPAKPPVAIQKQCLGDGRIKCCLACCCCCCLCVILPIILFVLLVEPFKAEVLYVALPDLCGIPGMSHIQYGFGN
jgi:hypothetical protein